MSKLKEDKLEALGQKAISLKKKLMEVLDTIYGLDESYGDKINEQINDESLMRS